jgi:glycine/D-amino acid oxidase-like deaminating enzyme
VALSDWPELAQQPWGRTAGEVLDLELSGVSSQQVTKRKFQLIPLEGQRFRWGGTYRNRPTDCLPSQEGREALTSGLEDLLGVAPSPEGSAPSAAQPTARVRAHRAAYRGNLRDHLPLVGRMPSREGRPPVWVLGALGSKGALWAPLCAKLLLGQITGQGAPAPGWERLGPRQNG